MSHHSRNTLPRREIGFVRGEGAYFWDSTGKRYLDLCSQTLNLLFGQCHPTLVASVRRALTQFTFSDQDFHSPLHDKGRDAIAGLLPSHLECFNLRMNDGSSAVECAVKQARRVTGRSRVLTVRGIYLGQNMLCIHLRGLGDRPADLLNGSREDVVFAPMPWPDDAVAFERAEAENGTAISRLVEQHADALACVIIDPIMISSGVFGGRAMRIFCEKAAEACGRCKVPLVFDECQSFGWVPDTTLAKHWDIPVDMICLGKGVGGGLPLAICAARSEYDVLDFGDADYTNGGNNIAIASLIASCKLIASKQEQDKFSHLAGVMRAAIDEGVGQRCDRVRTRGIGLIRCIEITKTARGPLLSTDGRSISQAIARRCLQRGVYIRTYGACIAMKPPRVIDPSDLQTGIACIFSVIDEVLEENPALHDEPFPDFSRAPVEAEA